MEEWTQIFGAMATILASGGAAWLAIVRHSKQWDEKHRREEAAERTDFRKSLSDHIDRMNSKMQVQEDRINDLQRDVLNCERDKIDLYSRVNELKLRLGEPMAAAQKVDP